MTAIANHQSATAVITVVAEQRLAPASVQQADPLEKKPVEPLQIRELQFCDGENFIAVEGSAPYGHGTLMYVKTK